MKSLCLTGTRFLVKVRPERPGKLGKKNSFVNCSRFSWLFLIFFFFIIINLPLITEFPFMGQFCNYVMYVHDGRGLKTCKGCPDGSLSHAWYAILPSKWLDKRITKSYTSLILFIEW